jgi:ABC-2 type transport system ATP-binding protein
MSISVAHLTKVYGEQSAVDDLSFSISKGEIVGFLGPNGAGKSTTMKVLTGYLPATTGNASICDLDVDAHPMEIKKKIGYLPESNPLYPDMYVKEYLAFAAGIYHIPNAAKRIGDIIALTGLTPECRKKIGALSKGYRQRVGLAQALLHDPEVLILDEPTSGLDPNQLTDMRNLIRELGKNKTVMLSTHIMQEVQAICNRVIIINKGKIVADDILSHLQHAASDTFLTIEFRENISPRWLEQIPGIKEFHQISSYVWNIITPDPDAVKKSLWQLALQNNLNIVSLQSNTPLLEDIFRKLTRDSGL